MFVPPRGQTDGPVRGIYEPVHGSAPDIAGTGRANPIGMILSVAMMFDYSVGRPDLARRIGAVVDRRVDAGVLTRDLGGVATTDAVTTRIVEELDA